MSATYLCNIQVIWLQQGGNGATHIDYIQKGRCKLLLLTGPPNYWEIRDKGKMKAGETHLFYLLVLCGLFAVKSWQEWLDAHQDTFLAHSQ